jgi:hypothetical protein
MSRTQWHMSRTQWRMPKRRILRTKPRYIWPRRPTKLRALFIAAVPKRRTPVLSVLRVMQASRATAVKALSGVPTTAIRGPGNRSAEFASGEGDTPPRRSGASLRQKEPTSPVGATDARISVSRMDLCLGPGNDSP